MEQFKKNLNSFERIVKHVARGSHIIAVAILAFMMFFTSTDIIVRMFAKPIKGGFELITYSTALLIFFSLGHTQIEKGYTSVSFFIDKLSSRAQAIFDLVTYLVSFILVSILTWQLAVHANRMYVGNNLTSDLRLPVYWFVIATAIGSSVFALTLLLDFLKSLVGVMDDGNGGKIV